MAGRVKRDGAERSRSTHDTQMAKPPAGRLADQRA